MSDRGAASLLVPPSLFRGCWSTSERGRRRSGGRAEPHLNLKRGFFGLLLLFRVEGRGRMRRGGAGCGWVNIHGAFKKRKRGGWETEGAGDWLLLPAHSHLTESCQPANQEPRLRLKDAGRGWGGGEGETGVRDDECSGVDVQRLYATLTSQPPHKHLMCVNRHGWVGALSFLPSSSSALHLPPASAADSPLGAGRGRTGGGGVRVVVRLQL